MVAAAGNPEHIARLLDEVRAAAGPQTWPRVEALVHALMELYGAGLARLLELVAEAHALDATLRSRLCADELLSSLLLLHRLHPTPTRERVEQALYPLRAHLERVAFDDGIVRIRLTDDCALESAQKLIERTIEEAAPEVTRIEVTGGRSEPRPNGLVQIRMRP
jgi:hypothetical protein